MHAVSARGQRSAPRRSREARAQRDGGAGRAWRTSTSGVRGHPAASVLVPLLVGGGGGGGCAPGVQAGDLNALTWGSGARLQAGKGAKRLLLPGPHASTPARLDRTPKGVHRCTWPSVPPESRVRLAPAPTPLPWGTAKARAKSLCLQLSLAKSGTLGLIAGPCAQGM